LGREKGKEQKVENREAGALIFPRGGKSTKNGGGGTLIRNGENKMFPNQTTFGRKNPG